MTAKDEHLLERRTLKGMASRKMVYFLLAMALAGGLLLVAGLAGMDKSPGKLAGLPDQAIMLVVGAVAFCLFFPWFLVVYSTGHLLRSLEALETVRVVAASPSLAGDGAQTQPIRRARRRALSGQLSWRRSVPAAHRGARGL